jgi:hypothetical protein
MNGSTGSIPWFHFSPPGSGGSFGREDMGVFCERGLDLFVVPLMEMSVHHISMAEVEQLVSSWVTNSEQGSVYELRNDKFVVADSMNWREKLRNSLITS